MLLGPPACSTATLLSGHLHCRSHYRCRRLLKNLNSKNKRQYRNFIVKITQSHQVRNTSSSSEQSSPTKQSSVQTNIFCSWFNSFLRETVLKGCNYCFYKSSVHMWISSISFKWWKRSPGLSTSKNHAAFRWFAKFLLFLLILKLSLK